MNNIRSFLILSAFLGSLALSAQTHRNDAIIVQFERDFFEREIYDREFQKQKVFRKSDNGPFRTGVREIDQIAQRFSKTEIRPVFITDPRRVEQHREFGLDLFFEISFSDTADLNLLLEAYTESGIVQVAEKVPVYTAEFMGANDPMYTQQWGLRNPTNPGMDIGVEAAWAHVTGNPQVVVAVIDNSIDLRHPDLIGNLWVNVGEIPGNGIDDDENGYVDDVHGWNFVDRNPDISPPYRAEDHGTHVAGIIGARTGNRMGIAGIAGGWGDLPGVSIMAFRAGRGRNMFEGYAAMVYAADNGAAIANNSWGGAGSTAAGRAAVDFFTRHGGGEIMNGGLVIAAAGNANNSNLSFPAAFANALAVGSIQQNGTRSGFSTYGDWVEIAAPGSDILSAIPENAYSRLSGTSMASPMVAGVAALILSATMDLDRNYKTPQWLRDILINTARPITTDQPIGPLVQAGAAINYIRITYGITTQIPDICESVNLIVFPNPTQGVVYIQSSDMTIQSIEIYNVLGQQVKELRGHHENVDLSHLPDGLYIFRIHSNEGIFQQRVLKQ
jgi:hypothetical protein